MNRKFRHYAVPPSLFSGKTRAYLRYKNIPYQEVTPNIWQMFRAIPRHTGVMAIPVVRTPEGEWLQDSSDIIEALEQRFPDSPVLPETPRQRLAACLLEMWGDCFWLPSAMYYRWAFPENRPLFLREMGQSLFPWWPGQPRRGLARRMADAMQTHLPGLGVTEASMPVIDAWTRAMLDALNAHFAVYDYLLGSRPSLGDFGLIGPLYAHLGRDPYPRRELIAPRPHLAAWIARVHEPRQPCEGAFLADDEVPDSLSPLLHSVIHEQQPFLESTQALVNNAFVQRGRERALPRSLAFASHPLGRGTLTRRVSPFDLWKLQRIQQLHAALPEEQREQARQWLQGLGGLELIDKRVRPRLRRVGFRVAASE